MKRNANKFSKVFKSLWSYPRVPRGDQVSGSFFTVCPVRMFERNLVSSAWFSKGSSTTSEWAYPFSSFTSFCNSKLKIQNLGLYWHQRTWKTGYVQPQSAFQISPWDGEKASNDLSSFQIQVKIWTSKELHVDFKIPYQPFFESLS